MEISVYNRSRIPVFHAIHTIESDDRSRMSRNKGRRRRKGTANERDVSELMWEIAGDFISMGERGEDMESLLNAACSAWNIACSSPETRSWQLDHYMKEYAKFNPTADNSEIAGVRGNIEKLVGKKLQVCPNDRRQIIGARVVNSDGKPRIEVASVRLH